MTNQDFNKVIEEQLEHCTDTLGLKGGEYGGATDRLRHFKTAGALQGVTPETALIGMMAKHTVSVVEMCKDKGSYSLKQWDEKIGDSINYLLLLAALIREDNYAEYRN